MKCHETIVIFAGFLAASVTGLAATTGDVVVSPNNKGVLVDKFFYDFKNRGNPNFSSSEMDDLFITDGFNGVRTPIYGNISKPAHPSNGVVVGSYYSGHVNMILEAKQRNPDLIVFASKKLDNLDSFPDWVKDANGVIPDQYAILLADYIEYMATQGIGIDVLGIDNEREYNEGNITPDRHKDIVDELNLLSISRGFPMPEIIGHEDYGPDKDNWMADLINNGWGDRLDIFGTHYYGKWRPLLKLQSDLVWAGSREKWHTELHWDKHLAGDMEDAEAAICAMWDCTDNDMNGLMWWAYSRTGFRGSITKDFSTPLIGAYPLATDDVDGADITTLGKLQTRAFLKGNEMTIFALNVNESVAYSNQVFRVDRGRILGDVSVLQWTSTNDTAGAVSTLTAIGPQTVEFTLPARSITRLTFTYAPGGPVSHYAFEGNANDSWSNALHGTEVAATYPPGREGLGLDGVVEVPFATFDDFLTTFWLKTDAGGGALITGDSVSVSLTDSNVVFSIGTNSVASFKPISDGRWHQVAAERLLADGSMRVYVDGRLEAYDTGATNSLVETNLVLGGISGEMDEVRFFDRAFGTSDYGQYGAPSVLLGVGGDAEERDAVESHITLSSCPAGADYPYIDLVEDDGTWLDAWQGTSRRSMDVADANNTVLIPRAGATYFTRTTDSWWRGMCKPQFDNLVLEAGTYSLSFYVGDGDTNFLFFSVNTDPVSGNHVGLTVTDPSAPVLPQMNSTASSLIHKLDTNIVANFDVSTVPADGSWTQWNIEYIVPTNSPLLGQQLGFLFRKPYSDGADPGGKSTGAFDGPMMLDFVPVAPAPVVPVAVDYSLAGSTATPVDDYNALPAQLSMDTNSIIPVVDLIEEGDETIFLTLLGSTNYYISGIPTGGIYIVDHPMDGWRAEQFGADATNASVSADSANPDGDDFTNEEEWALVTEPLVKDVPGMNSAVSGSSFVISYDLRINSGYTIGASWSWSLTDPDWRTDNMTVIPAGLNGDVETIAVIVPIEGMHKFIRLELGE